MSKSRVMVLAAIAIAFVACTDREQSTDEAKKADSPLAPAFLVNSEPPQKSTICTAYEGELTALTEHAAANPQENVAAQLEGLTAIVEDVCN